MKRTSSRILCMLLCLIVIVSAAAIPALAAPTESTPVITSYTVKNVSGKVVGEIQKGTNVSFEINIKNTSVKTSDITGSGDLDATKVVDSFTGGSVTKTELVSTGDDPLEFKVTISNMVYSGSGSSLKFMVGYKNTTLPYDTITLDVAECVEYTDTPVVDPDPIVVPAPVAEITRADIGTIKAGQEFTLKLYIKNTSTGTTMESPVVSFTPSDALMIMDATMSKVISSIRPGATATVEVKLKALSEITSPAQSVDVDVKFNYYSGSSGTTQGSSSEKILIPATTSTGDAVTPPVLQITRSEISGAVKADQELTLTITVKNTSDLTIEEPIAFLTPSEAFMITDGGSTRVLSAIGPKKSATFTVKLKALSEIANAAQSLTVDMKYRYTAASASTQAETSEKLWIPAEVKTASEDPAQTQGATPNVIISQYSYGESAQVAAGGLFDLKMTFRNTSSSFKVENIVMTLTTGEGLSISSSSNTLYYASMGAGASLSETIGIQALPTAKTGSANIDVSFSYEYVDNGQRNKVTTTQSIAIPIYQPDRFEVELPALPDFVNAYEEMYLSLPYINKGKSEVSNVRAEIVSEDGAVTSINPVQNLGNFESGKSGTIDFIFTPNMSGEVNFTIKITYEDPNAQEQTIEYPVALNVEEPYYPPIDDPTIDDPSYEDPSIEEKGGLPWWVYLLIALVVILIVVLIIVKVRKRRALTSVSEDFHWEDEEEKPEEAMNEKR